MVHKQDVHACRLTILDERLDAIVPPTVTAACLHGQLQIS